jgi:hypothetical protein
MFDAFFDTKIGCVLEWSVSTDAEVLKNVESLVLGTGFQKSDNEVVVFHCLFDFETWGCAAFHLLHTELSTERYSRMRAVGILVKNIVAGRSLAPILTWVAAKINKNPGHYEAIKELAEILMREDAVCSDAWTWFRGKTASHHVSDPLSPPLESDLNKHVALDHPYFLVLLRAVLARRRVLLFSRTGATQLCDICLDLAKCAGLIRVAPPTAKQADTRRRSCTDPLVFMTAAYALGAKGASGHPLLAADPCSSWLMATTDISLAATMAAWEVLMVLHRGEEDSGFSIACDGKDLCCTHSDVLSVGGAGQQMALALRRCDTHSKCWSPIDRTLDAKLWAEMGGMGGVVAWRKTLFSRLDKYSQESSKDAPVLVEDIARACDVPTAYEHWLYTICLQSGVHCSPPPTRWAALRKILRCFCDMRTTTQRKVKKSAVIPIGFDPAPFT